MAQNRRIERLFLICRRHPLPLRFHKRVGGLLTWGRGRLFFGRDIPRGQGLGVLIRPRFRPLARDLKAGVVGHQGELLSSEVSQSPPDGLRVGLVSNQLADAGAHILEQRGARSFVLAIRRRDPQAPHQPQLALEELGQVALPRVARDNPPEVVQALPHLSDSHGPLEVLGGLKAAIGQVLQVDLGVGPVLLDDCSIFLGQLVELILVDRLRVCFGCLALLPLFAGSRQLPFVLYVRSAL